VRDQNANHAGICNSSNIFRAGLSMHHSKCLPALDKS
jgi:hypothetical protein